MAVIETKMLTKNYGKARGVFDVNLSVEEGEIFGFIGPNGAGKSTTIRALLGFIRPTAGSALLFGQSAAEHPGVLRDVGYLPSEVFYYSGMRVADLLRYSASFYHKDCSRRIKELCERMDLDPKRRIDDLSFGNRKKVGIVQGLLHEPKLIILDEPTGGLDPLMQKTFFELIGEENAKGATVFFSSHIRGEVQRLCSRVAFIKDGGILRQEKISTLQENSYKRFAVESKTAIPERTFDLAGVSDLKLSGESASFIFRGDLNAVTARVASLPLRNLSVAEPDLEEIFLHYYEKEDEAK